MLDVVFGEIGITESENKKELSKNLEVACSVLDAYEKNIQGNDSKKFSAYLKDREKTVLRKLICSSRRKALKTNPKIPPRLYTNQSESVNSILAAKKVALGYNKKDDVTQSFFMQKIWKATVDYKSLEIEKAICNRSNEFHAGHAEYLSASLEDWFNMSRQNQETYVQQLRMMSNGNIKNKNNIVIPEGNTTQAPIIEVLSLKLTEVIHALLHASDIEKKALRLINMPRAITENPTLDINKNHKTYFVAGEKQQKYYTVVKSEKNTLNTLTNYKGFEYACICSHSVAVAERDSLLKGFLEQVKSNRRKGNKFCSSNGLAGVDRNRQQQRRVRKYNSSTERKPSEGTSPFTDIWHNNKLLWVIRVGGIPENKCVCSYCGNEFPRGPIAVVPFDIALAHEERRKYLNRNRERPRILAVCYE